MKDNAQANAGKFENPALTAKGEPRATVALSGAETLWFNTGTLCNIECVNCYIASSPKNDALVYITADEVRDYLDQIEERNWPVREIAFTGGEPVMNPQQVEITQPPLERGYQVLHQTTGTRPITRNTVLRERI